MPKEQKTLPKINVAPSMVGMDDQDINNPQDSLVQSNNFKEWNPSFTIMLVVLVILVNVALTILFGSKSVTDKEAVAGLVVEKNIPIHKEIKKQDRSEGNVKDKISYSTEIKLAKKDTSKDTFSNLPYGDVINDAERLEIIKYLSKDRNNNNYGKYIVTGSLLSEYGNDRRRITYQWPSSKERMQILSLLERQR